MPKGGKGCFFGGGEKMKKDEIDGIFDKLFISLSLLSGRRSFSFSLSYRG